jgi:hypothetical protein
MRGAADQGLPLATGSCTQSTMTGWSSWLWTPATAGRSAVSVPGKTSVCRQVLSGIRQDLARFDRLFGRAPPLEPARADRDRRAAASRDGAR